MIEPGRGLGYLVLFSEIGVSLLVTTLVGVLAGYWVGQQIGKCLVQGFAKAKDTQLRDPQRYFATVIDRQHVQPLAAEHGHQVLRPDQEHLLLAVMT